MKLMMVVFMAGLMAACGVAAGGISVAFPAERQRLGPSEVTYLIGAVNPPGRTELLYVNGITTDVWRTGAFLAMVPVQPGTNVVTLRCGRDWMQRTFTVAEPAKGDPPRPIEPVVSSEDPRLGEASAWKMTGETLFHNRVRSVPDGSDAIYFLPPNFVLRGAEIKGTDWLAVWLEDRIGYVARSLAKRMPDVALPPQGLLAPDVTAGFAELPPYGKAPELVRVCVDAGHGGSDSGAVSPHGWREKDVNLLQALVLRDALEKAGFQVLMTREDDTFPKLMARPKLAYDERVDVFISVHHNATASHRNPREARHTTTYASNAKGLALATAIQRHIAKVVQPVKDAGAQIKSLAVCRNPAVPSCLLEVDFINLPEGEEASWNPERQRKVADAVVCGLLDWMTPPPPAAAADGTNAVKEVAQP